MKYFNKRMAIILLLHISVSLLGVWFIIYPTKGLGFFRFYVSTILIIAAIVTSVIYNRSVDKNARLITQAIVMGVFGVALLLSASFTSMTLNITFVVWMFIEGFICLKKSYKYKKEVNNGWLTYITYGLIIIASGVSLLIINNLEVVFLVRLVGIFMVSRSVVNILDMLIYRRGTMVTTLI